MLHSTLKRTVFVVAVAVTVVDVIYIFPGTATPSQPNYLAELNPTAALMMMIIPAVGCRISRMLLLSLFVMLLPAMFSVVHRPVDGAVHNINDLVLSSSWLHWWWSHSYSSCRFNKLFGMRIYGRPRNAVGWKN